MSKVAVYSSENMTVARMQPSTNEKNNNLYAQEIDFRVNSGDLTISHTIKPLDSLQDNSLLLAAEGNLILSYDYEDFSLGVKSLTLEICLRKNRVRWIWILAHLFDSMLVIYLSKTFSLNWTRPWLYHWQKPILILKGLIIREIRLTS